VAARARVWKARLRAPTRASGIATTVTSCSKKFNNDGTIFKMKTKEAAGFPKVFFGSLAVQV
jgi:hypothetical protein